MREESSFLCVSQARDEVLFILVRGRYLAEASVVCKKVGSRSFHAKMSSRRLKVGPAWPAGLGFSLFGADLLVDAPDLL